MRTRDTIFMRELPTSLFKQINPGQNNAPGRQLLSFWFPFPSYIFPLTFFPNPSFQLGDIADIDPPLSQMEEDKLKNSWRHPGSPQPPWGIPR